MSAVRCFCGHVIAQHALYKEKCVNCGCSQFRLSLSRTAAEAERLDASGAEPTHTERETLTQTDRSGSDAVTIDVPDSGLKDSGKRLQFDSGMVRDVDDNKPAFDLVIPEGIPYDQLLLTRWADLLRKGAIKYSRRNWEKADSTEELDRAKASAFRHFMQWFTGEDDEDHAAAVLFNINEVETIRWKQTTGRGNE